MKELIKSQESYIELDERDQESLSYIKLKYKEMLMTRKIRDQVKGDRLIEGNVIFHHNENMSNSFAEVFNEPVYRQIINFKQNKLVEIENSIIYDTKSEKDLMKREGLEQFRFVRISDEIQETNPKNTIEKDS
jgi:hypothetical protein